MTGFAALLAELEARWLELGVPVDRVLNPGADPVAVERTLCDALGAAPPQLVAWFAWHDGSPWEAQWEAAPLGRPLLSLQHGLDRRQELLLSNRPETTDEGYPMPQWRPSWLPIGDASSSDYTAVDGVTGEMLEVDYWDPEFVTTVAFTLDLAVRHWLRVLDTGLYRWQDGKWTSGWQALPDDLRVRGLVN